MIINGGSRENHRFFATHLLRADHNEAVNVREIRGLMSDNLRDALQEMDAVASGSRTENFMYHANLNARADELLTPDQWNEAIDRLEHNLGLDGHARVVVEHVKDGRTHTHVIWNRVDPDTMTAVSDSFNYQKHEQTSREIEEAFGLSHVDSVLVADRGTERKERRPKDYETFRAAETKIDPQAMKAEITALWSEADSGQAFKAAVEEAGYILVRGDRSGFMLIDAAGDDHALGRRLDGPKARDVAARMADVDRDALPNVAEGRQMARDAAASSGSADPQPELGATTERPKGREFQPLQAAELETAPEHQAGRYEAAERRTAEDFRQADDTHTEDGDYLRLTPWGRVWRAVTDFAVAAADQFNDYLRDERSGTPDEERGPWVRLIGAGRNILGGYFHSDGERLSDGLEEAKALAIQEALRRLDAATPPDYAEAHHPAEEHHREPSRPGGDVEPPEPDDRPQSEPETPLDALDEAALAWMSSSAAPEADDRAEAEPEGPEPDGLDFEP